LGVLPAVDVGQSVSRVGGKAQRPTYRAVAGDLKLAYAQFEELETFARFGARLDKGNEKIIEHGKRIRECLKQPQSTPVPLSAQISLLLALALGLLDQVALDEMTAAQQAVYEASARIPAEVQARFEADTPFQDDDRAMVIKLAKQALAPFLPQPEVAAEPKSKPPHEEGP
jgi:F-type H+-transporting ATPase subunit alpha